MTNEAWELDEPENVSAASPPPLVRIVEALLFVGGQPLTATRASEVIRGLSVTQFTQTIDALNRDYRRQGRPYMVEAHGQGYVLTLRLSHRHVLNRLYGTMREARLSPPAIDVLALVAYRQPVNKQEIDSVRSGIGSFAPYALAPGSDRRHAPRRGQSTRGIVRHNTRGSWSCSGSAAWMTCRKLKICKGYEAPQVSHYEGGTHALKH